MNNLKYRLNYSEPLKSNWLEEHHFFWSSIYQEYIYRFNVWRISETSSAYGEVRLNPETYEVDFEVYEDKKTLFGPYYSHQWEVEVIPEMDIVNNRIKTEFDRIGIVIDEEKSLPTPTIHHMGIKEVYE